MQEGRRQRSVEPPPDDAPDVRRYLFKLLALLALGAALMVTVAVIAWNKYAGNLVETTRPAPMPTQTR
jgi:hypothetical protein